jgi:hypothetical protein
MKTKQTQMREGALSLYPPYFSVLPTSFLKQTKIVFTSFWLRLSIECVRVCERERRIDLKYLTSSSYHHFSLHYHYQLSGRPWLLCLHNMEAIVCLLKQHHELLKLLRAF